MIACVGSVYAGGLSFKEASALAEKAPHDDGYQEKWDAFNNGNKLDEKDGCYAKTPSVTTQQVLVIDKAGFVTEVVADIDNPKSQCFRSSYLHVQFPAPPFAPYYLRLTMAAMQAAQPGSSGR